jgi:hypothetical protein
MSERGESTSGFSVAVFGAAGHTGRFVVAELLRRGIRPIAIGRDLSRLAAAHLPEHGAVRRLASLNDAEALDGVLDGAQAVINCAGPFLETAEVVAAAAVRRGIHYLDVTAEQASARATLDTYDAVARKAGIAIIPAMGFYGGFADLLVTAVVDDWDSADEIEIMIGLDGWHPTQGTRMTGARNTVPRLVVSKGQLVRMPLPAAERDWEFGDPLGRQTVVEVPFSEMILIERHVKSNEIHSWLSRIALDDIRNPATPPPEAAEEGGRSPQRFIVDVVARRDGTQRRISARGQDIYAFSAPLICEACVRLLDGRYSSGGAHPPGAILDARDFLFALVPDHLTFETMGM